MIRSQLIIFYDNPALSKFKKFLNFINCKEPKVSIFAMGFNKEESTDTLIKYITPEEGVKPTDKLKCLLDSHIDYEQTKIQKAINKKAAKIEKRISEKARKAEAERQYNIDEANLEQNIQDMIDMTK